MRSPRPRTRETLAAAALLLLFALAAGVALRADSSVADEHPHILAGWSYWRTGHFAGGLDNPPLGQLWISAWLAASRRAYLYPSDATLALCRVPVLVLGLALGGLVWRWGRALGGATAGLGALAAYALEPNLLAHAHLATLDLPLTALWCGALWAWRGFSGDGDGARRRWGVAFALLFAAATLTKFTGIFLLPAVGLAALVARPRGVALRRFAFAGLAGVAVLFVAAHLAYGFGPTRHALPEALWTAVAGKFAHREEVRFAYLAGRRSEAGFASYYLVAILLKTPLPLLALAGVGVASLARRGARADLALLVVPAVVVVAAFTAIHVNIGVRHVLPVYPALALAAGLGVAALWRRGRVGRAVLLALALAWVGGVARVAPQWLSYFNVLAGGPAGGHRWLLDSNLDWGQDDARLARCTQEMSRRDPDWAVDPDPDVPRTGHFAVDANALHNLQRRSDRAYAWLRHQEPAGFAGYSWRIYALDDADYERAARAWPDDPAAVVAAAEIATRRGDAARGAALLAAAAGRFAGHATFVEMAALAARAAQRGADWDAALGWTGRGLAARPEDPELLGLAHQCRLERALAIAGDATVAARAASELGLWRAEIGEEAAALPLLQRASEGLSDDPEVQRAFAVGLAHAGDYAAAHAVLTRPGLRGRFPEEEAVCRELGRADAALGRGDPVEPKWLLELGRAAFDAGRYDAAAAAFAEAFRTNPEDGVALAYLGEMQVRSKLRVVPERLTPRSLARRREGAR